MKFSHEEKVTPTFRKWASKPTCPAGSKLDIVRIFSNDEWRTITFVTEEFRLNIKYPTTQEFDKTSRELTKLLKAHVRAYIEYEGGTKAEVTIVPASDADDSPAKFTKDDLGWNRD